MRFIISNKIKKDHHVSPCRLELRFHFTSNFPVSIFYPFTFNLLNFNIYECCVFCILPSTHGQHTFLCFLFKNIYHTNCVCSLHSYVSHLMTLNYVWWRNLSLMLPTTFILQHKTKKWIRFWWISTLLAGAKDGEMNHEKIHIENNNKIYKR